VSPIVANGAKNGTLSRTYSFASPVGAPHTVDGNGRVSVVVLLELEVNPN
jgi:hypothetical protein